MRTWIITFFFLSSAAHAWGQIGFWTDHLPYYETIDVAEDGQGLIFCATPYAVFTYDHPTKSVTRYSKTSVLSDVGVSAIGYSKQQKVLSALMMPHKGSSSAWQAISLPGPVRTGSRGLRKHTHQLAIR